MKYIWYLLCSPGYITLFLQFLNPIEWSKGRNVAKTARAWRYRHFLAPILTAFYVFILFAIVLDGGRSASGGSSYHNVTTSYAIPEQFHGTWTLNTDGIHHRGEDPDTIHSYGLNRHESIGEVTTVTIYNESKIKIDQNVRAEGDAEWSETFFLHLADDQQSLVIGDESGNGVTRFKCRVVKMSDDQN